MGEDICSWELFLKALCRFIRVGRKCSYIDECSHPRVRARRSDDRAAVRVPNHDYGTADPLQSPSHVGDILGVRIESVLRCDHLMSLGQKGRDEFAEARAVCPEAVDEDDAGFALICHNFAPFVQLEEDCLSSEGLDVPIENRSLPFPDAYLSAREAAEVRRSSVQVIQFSGPSPAVSFPDGHPLQIRMR